MLLSSMFLLYLLSRWAKEKKKRKWGRRRKGDPPDFDPDVGGGYSEFVGEGGVTFVPSMRYQRLAAVRTLLRDHRWNGEIRKVADLGCGEFAFAEILRDLPLVEEYCGVDYLESQLREKLPRLSALADYLRAVRRRATLRVLAGSVAEPDDRLAGCDAIICIEVIEHLYPDVLECVPYTVFGCARPRVAIFSTPNSEFNFLFGDARKFRDSDHKFEWTREQFKCWASNIVLRYPEYSVEFYGVGRGPTGTTHVGCCTQLALFHRAKGYDDNSLGDDARCGQPYVSVHEFEVEPLPPADEEESLYTWVNLGDEESSSSGSDSWDTGWAIAGGDDEFGTPPEGEGRGEAAVPQQSRGKDELPSSWGAEEEEEDDDDCDDWGGSERLTECEKEFWCWKPNEDHWDPSVPPFFASSGRLRAEKVDKAVQTGDEGEEEATEERCCDWNIGQTEEEEPDRDVADVWL